MAPSLDRIFAGLGQGLSTFAGLQGQANRYKDEQAERAAERDRQIKRDALSKALTESTIANNTADNERADYQMGQTLRNQGLARGDAERKRITESVMSRFKAPEKAPNIDPLSPEGITARLKLDKGLTAQKPPAAAKPVPASLRKAVAVNNQTISSIDEAIKQIEAHPDVLHRWDSFLPEIARKFTESPEDVGVRAPVADVGSLQIHDRTGANMNIREEPRLAPFVPDIRDKSPNALIKLKRLRTRLVEMNDGIQSDNGGSVDAVTDAERAALKAQGYSDEEINAIP